MNMKTTIGLLGVALSAGVVSGAEPPFLELRTIELQPNQAGQTVALADVFGLGQQVAGVNFNIQVADGGPEAGGSLVGPKITAVDIVGVGTIFHGNNNGQSGGGSLVPQIFEAVTTTRGETVEADGTLAFVTFDTTGFNSGMFDLFMGATLNGPTELLNTAGDNVLTVQDGKLWIVPERSTLTGDANHDGTVGFDDFLILSSHFGAAGGWEDGDFNFDGVVDFSDFLGLSANFGQSSNVSRNVAVPEPGSLMLLGIGISFVRRRR